jgi:3-deoxy-7-phosphoheptulonate synthase
MENNMKQTSSTTQTVKVGPYEIGGQKFAVIAGPCSIESEQQFTDTAMSVKASGACLLRGGAWKMRSSVQSFQGLGSEAIKIIRTIMQKVQMPLVSEVTDIRQIEELHDVVDMFQVGARNMHNTALLKELGGLQKPILLKRGFSAYIEEWIQAAAYITSAGNKNVILCERGIRTFETATRNTLDLNAVVYVKKNTNLPVIVDPSHAVGISALVSDLALAAAAAGADGLIIEVHPRPSEALSDGMQALTFDDFSKLMVRLEKVLTAVDKQLVRPML